MTKEETILAVAPGTRHFGAAVFRNGELRHFAVNPLGKLSETGRLANHESLSDSVARMLKPLQQKFEPTVLVLKELNRQQLKSANLKSVFDAFRAEAKQAGIETTTISFETVKKLFCSDRKLTKAKVFEKLSSFFPELAQFCNHPSRWQRKYYTPMLLAAAAGFTFWIQSERRK